MKRYIFCEAWRQFKFHKKCINKTLMHDDGKTFSYYLKKVSNTAKNLKNAGFNFNYAWCNK